MENVAPGQQLADTRLPSMDCTRPSLELFNALPSRPGSAAAQQNQRQQRVQNAQVAADPQAAGAEGLLSLCAMLGVQANMQQALARLAAVARDLPVPMRMLVTLSAFCVCRWRSRLRQQGCCGARHESPTSEGLGRADSQDTHDVPHLTSRWRPLP